MTVGGGPVTDAQPRHAMQAVGTGAEGPKGRVLTLAETLELIAPVEGPRDQLPELVDVLIVGAGPVGLTVANLLGSFGVDCLLIEQKPVTSDMPKAIAVDDEYMRLLDRLELTRELSSHTSRPFGVYFISPFGFVLVKVPGFITPNGFGNRNAVLQPVFEKILLQGCGRFANVRRHYGASLSAISQDGALVATTVQTDAGAREVKARYVLACDGARSFVRTALDVPFPGTRIDEPHLVLDLADFPDQVDHSRFFCNPARPVNSVPAPYGGRRMEFMLSPDDDREHILSDAGIRELVDRHTPYRGVRLNIIRRAIYGFSERVAERLHDGRVFLLGDAAHVMPPFGGQGMNTGARDAANLCWKLVSVLHGDADPAVLASYDPERRQHIRATVDYSVKVGRLANIRSRGLSIIRDMGFALANLLPNVRRYFREMRYVPRPFLTQGLLVHRPEGDDGITGRILPRLGLINADGEATSIDQAAGPWFALVGLEVPLSQLQSLVHLSPWSRLKPSLVSLVTNPVAGQDGIGLFSVNDERGRTLLARHAGKILVLRPDRYVAGSVSYQDFNLFSDQFEALLRNAATGSAGSLAAEPDLSLLQQEKTSL